MQLIPLFQQYLNVFLYYSQKCKSTNYFLVFTRNIWGCTGLTVCSFVFRNDWYVSAKDRDTLGVEILQSFRTWYIFSEMNQLLLTTTIAKCQCICQSMTSALGVTTLALKFHTATTVNQRKRKKKKENGFARGRECLFHPWSVTSISTPAIWK